MGLNIQRPHGAYTGTPGGEAFPIGSVFITVVSTDPATLLGYGTWSSFGAGRVLVGLDSGDTDFDVVEETGGAKTVASAGSVAAPADHSAHTHTGPSHQHNLSGGASTAHSHTYTQVIDHVHVQNLPSSQTGSQASGTRDTSTTGSTADALSTANPTGSVGATGTTANNTGGVTDNAGTGNTGNPSATLTHNAPTFTGSATSVVQPYIVVYMWKRTA